MICFHQGKTLSLPTSVNIPEDMEISGIKIGMGVGAAILLTDYPTTCQGLRIISVNPHKEVTFIHIYYG